MYLEGIHNINQTIISRPKRNHKSRVNYISGASGVGKNLLMYGLMVSERANSTEVPVFFATESSHLDVLQKLVGCRVMTGSSYGSRVLQEVDFFLTNNPDTQLLCIESLNYTSRDEVNNVNNQLNTLTIKHNVSIFVGTHLRKENK